MRLKVLRAATVAIATLFVCNLSQAQDKTTELVTEGIRISFVPPSGLRQFSEREMEMVREKEGDQVRFIFNDSQNDLTLVIDAFGLSANEQGLVNVIRARARNHKKWLRQDFITINDQRWFSASVKTRSRSDELIDTYYVTDWAGQYVLFDFRSPAARYGNYKSIFERSAQSVRLGASPRQ